MRALAAAVIAAGLVAAPQAMRPATVRVLFIGNSLTTANDLPAMVGQLASFAKLRFESRTVAFPDFSLEDHWANREAQKAIASGSWSFVVLQQGPSALPESRVLLREYVRRFDPLIRKAGGRTALYMVWPSLARFADFDGVRDSYRIAAADVSGVFIPAGEVWREAWQRNPRLAFYGPDEFHPTRLGTYAAAAAMFRVFFDHSTSGLPTLGLSDPDVRVVQETVDAAIARKFPS